MLGRRKSLESLCQSKFDVRTSNPHFHNHSHLRSGGTISLKDCVIHCASADAPTRIYTGSLFKEISRNIKVVDDKDRFTESFEVYNLGT